MKLNCMNCGHGFVGLIHKDELGWHSNCPVCGASSDVAVQKGRYELRIYDINAEYSEELYYSDSNVQVLVVGSIGTIVVSMEKLIHVYEGQTYCIKDTVTNKIIVGGIFDPNDIDYVVDYIDNVINRLETLLCNVTTIYVDEVKETFVDSSELYEELKEGIGATDEEMKSLLGIYLDENNNLIWNEQS